MEIVHNLGKKTYCNLYIHIGYDLSTELFRIQNYLNEYNTCNKTETAFYFKKKQFQLQSFEF